MRRREFIGILGGAAVWPNIACAQSSAQVLEVGYLYPGPNAAAASRIAAFTSGLLAGGLRVPEQVTIIPRVTNGDNSQLAPMAADLVARKVYLIMAVGPAAVRTARAATTTIPILAGDLESDPVGSGFVASHSRPGGNITGVFLDLPDFSKKWLEALKEAVTPLSTVAVFWDPSTGRAQLEAIEAAATTLQLKLLLSEVGSRNAIEPAFQAAKRQDAGALVILSSPLFGGNTKLLAELATAHRLPAVTLFTDFAREGGLMAYGPNILAFTRLQGVMAAKLLRGAKPADTPIEAPIKFEFVLNLQAARRLELAVPPSVLLRADEVIE